jgi:hypothetical protein
LCHLDIIRNCHAWAFRENLGKEAILAMQLNGELSKTTLFDVLRQAHEQKLTGKFLLTNAAQVANVYVERGRLVHAESESQIGRDALVELFVWQTGRFAFSECNVKEIPGTFSPKEPLEKILTEGKEYVEQKKYVDRLGITGKTILRLTPAAEDADDVDNPLLDLIDGKKTLYRILGKLNLSRRTYINSVYELVSKGLAAIDTLAAPDDVGALSPAIQTKTSFGQMAKSQLGQPLSSQSLSSQPTSNINLPDWVVARLLLDNADLSQAIVDLVIWADRVKCWLYQADAELEGFVGKLEESATTADAKSASQTAPQHTGPAKRVSKLADIISSVDEPQE